MADVTKDSTFQGLEDFAPAEVADFAKELSRRLERYNNSLFLQLKRENTVYTNAAGDAPTGMKSGDVWLRPDGYFKYDGAAWSTDGASGTFTTVDGKTVTVENGLITAITS